MSGQMMPLTLASTSNYRRALLAKLGFPFSLVDPDYIEASVPNESPREKSLRLALGKAVAGSKKSPLSTANIIIGSDQVAHCEDTTFSKPGTFEKAFDQLRQCAGKWVTFSTGVCLTDNRGQVLSHFCEEYELKYRELDDETIRWYLELESPYDCAGAIKAEAHGIVLIEDTRGQDINTLYGLPLIKLLSELHRLREPQGLR